VAAKLTSVKWQSGRMRRSLLLGFLTALLTLGAALPASAAPQYQSSSPEDGEVVHKAPAQVSVTFSEPLDESSQMIVKDHCGNRLDDKNIEISLNEMSVGIAKKPAGHYMVTYRATGIGGVTGSTNGTFSFKVHAGTECSGGTHHHGGSETGHQNHEGPGTHEGHEGQNHEGRQSGHEGHAAGTHEDHAAHEDHLGHAAQEEHAADQHHHHPDEEPLNLAQQKQRRYGEIASGESAIPPIAPDTPAVFASLALAAAFGVIGGWVLRVSSSK
jgi:methionine-rich copper-binding protein CopC